MGRFTAIPQNTFEEMQLGAGVLLSRFDPATGDAPADEDIICATTGGIGITCKPTYVDQGDNVDNCPKNTKELKQLTGWECSMSATCLGTSPKSIRLSLGAADVDAAAGKITPRMDLKQTDFSSIWGVGDKANDGMVAVQLIDALSTDGFSYKTEDKGKGKSTLALTGHVSIKDQKRVPMEFYSTDPIEETHEEETA